MPVIYILDLVILKYTTERFVREIYQDINQVFRNKSLNGSELFITHSFITEYPKDEELNQEQMRRIVKPIQKMLLAEFRSQKRVEDELQKVLPLLQDQGLSGGYASQNISHLIQCVNLQ
jgi:hypothetical protein